MEINFLFMENDVAEQLSTVTENLPEPPDLFSGKCLSEYFCLPDKNLVYFHKFFAPAPIPHTLPQKSYRLFLRQ